MQPVLGQVRGLQQGEAPERHRRGLGAQQLQILAQEIGRVGQHVAVQEQQGGRAGVAGQAVAPLGTALVLGQLHQPGREGHRLDGGAHMAGQLVVARAIVEQHDLDRAGHGGGLGIQRGDQPAGIVVEEGDQHRQPGAGGGPGGVVEDPLLDVSVHAGAPCSAWTMCRRRERMPAASSAKAQRP